MAETKRGWRPARLHDPARRPRTAAPPPVLVRQLRNGVVEAVHRGDVVEVDAAGRMIHVMGDPDRVVNLRAPSSRSGCTALLRARRHARSST